MKNIVRDTVNGMRFVVPFVLIVVFLTFGIIWVNKELGTVATGITVGTLVTILLSYLVGFAKRIDSGKY